MVKLIGRGRRSRYDRAELTNPDASYITVEGYDQDSC